MLLPAAANGTHGHVAQHLCGCIQDLHAHVPALADRNAVGEGTYSAVNVPSGGLVSGWRMAHGAWPQGGSTLGHHRMQVGGR